MVEAAKANDPKDLTFLLLRFRYANSDWVDHRVRLTAVLLDARRQRRRRREPDGDDGQGPEGRHDQLPDEDQDRRLARGEEAPRDGQLPEVARSRSFPYDPRLRSAGPCGEVLEWLIRTVSKTVLPERVTWVRIPPSPPADQAGRRSSPGAPFQRLWSQSQLCGRRRTASSIFAVNAATSSTSFPVTGRGAETTARWRAVPSLQYSTKWTGQPVFAAATAIDGEVSGRAAEERHGDAAREPLVDDEDDDLSLSEKLEHPPHRPALVRQEAEPEGGADAFDERGGGFRARDLHDDRRLEPRLARR